MTATLTIAEVSARSPDMDASSFAEMVESIRKNGQLVPIVLSGSEIIDGRKRYAACQQLGIEPRVINLDPSQDREDVAAALNLLRTHYTPSQRAMFAAGRANATKGDRRTPGQMHKQVHLRTVEQVAGEVGVHRNSVESAKRIIRTAAPEVVDAVRSGDLTLHAANQIAKVIPRSEQATAVQKVVSASAGNARISPTASVLGIDGRNGRLRGPLPACGIIANIVDRFESDMGLMEQQAEREGADACFAEIATRLRAVRTRMSALIHSMEKKS